jgi:hypothetical protein
MLREWLFERVCGGAFYLSLYASPNTRLRRGSLFRAFYPLGRTGTAALVFFHVDGEKVKVSRGQRGDPSDVLIVWNLEEKGVMTMFVDLAFYFGIWFFGWWVLWRMLVALSCSK